MLDDAGHGIGVKRKANDRTFSLGESPHHQLSFFHAHQVNRFGWFSKARCNLLEHERGVAPAAARRAVEQGQPRGWGNGAPIGRRDRAWQREAAVGIGMDPPGNFFGRGFGGE